MSVLQIQPFSGKSCADSSLAVFAISCPYPLLQHSDPKENFRLLLIEIDKTNQRFIIIKRIKKILLICKPRVCFLLFLIWFEIINGIITVVIPRCNFIFF